MRGSIEAVLYSDASEVAVRRCAAVALPAGGSVEALHLAVCQGLRVPAYGWPEVRLYRPLLEQSLWSKGVAEVGAGHMTWERLCERFLADVVDGDDVAHVVEGTHGFVVAIVPDGSGWLPRSGCLDLRVVGAAQGRASPVLSALSTPPRSASPVSTTSSSSSSSEARRHHAARARRQATPDTRRGGAKGWVSATTTTHDAGPAVLTTTHDSVVVVRRDSTPVVVRSHQRPSEEGRVALLAKAATRWAATHNEEDGAIAHHHHRSIYEHDAERRFALGVGGETPGAYVEALRCARRDVDKLRGAQEIAALLMEREEKRVQRGWRAWKADFEGGARTLARRGQACGRLGRVYARHDSRRVERRLRAWRDRAVGGSRAVRKGAGAALLLAAFKRRRRFLTRRAVRAWRGAVARLSKKAREALRVAATGARRQRSHHLRRGFAAWRDRTRLIEERGLARDHARKRGAEGLVRRCSQKRGGAEKRLAFGKWRSSTARRQDDEALRSMEVAVRGLVFFKSLVVQKAQGLDATRVRKAFGTWRLCAHAIRLAARLLEDRCGGLAEKLRHRACRRALEAWRGGVAEASRRRWRSREVLRKAAGRFRKRSVFAGFAAWRAQAAARTRLAAALVRVGRQLLAAAATDRAFEAASMKRALVQWRTCAAAAIDRRAREGREAVALESMRVAAASHHLALEEEKKKMRAVLLVFGAATAYQGARSTAAARLRAAARRLWGRWRSAALGARDADRAVRAFGRVALRWRVCPAKGWAWRRWREGAARATRRTTGLRRAAARLARRDLWGSFHRWVRAAARRTRAGALVRRAVATLAQKSLAAGLRQWKGADAWAVAKIRLCKAALARMRNAKLFDAWSRWRRRGERTRRTATVLRRCVARIRQRHRLWCAWARWRSQSRRALGLARSRAALRRCANGALRRDLANGWAQLAHGVSFKAHTVQVQEARRAAVRVGLLSVFAARCGGAVRAIQAEALVRWRARLALQTATRQKTRRLTAQLAKRDVAAAWRTWTTLEAVARKRRRGRRTLAAWIHRMRRAGQMAAWRTWVATTQDTTGGPQSRDRRLMVRVTRRIGSRAVGRAWRQWRLAAAAAGLRTGRLRAVVVRMLRFRLCVPFAHWRRAADVAAASQRRCRTLRRCFARMARADLLRGWRQFADRCRVQHARKREMRRVAVSWVNRRRRAAWARWRGAGRRRLLVEHRLRGVLCSMRRRDLAAGWRTWRDGLATLDRWGRASVTVRRVAARFARRDLFNGWRLWVRRDAALGKRRKRLHLAARRLRNLKTASAWLQWRTVVRDGRRRAELVAKSVAKMRRVHVARAFRQLLAAVRAGHREAALMGAVIRKAQRVKLWAAWHHWRLADRRLVARAHSAGLVRRILCGLHHRDLLRAWRQWIAAHIVRSEGSLRAARAVRGALRRMVTFKVAKAWRTWRDFDGVRRAWEATCASRATLEEASMTARTRYGLLSLFASRGGRSRRALKLDAFLKWRTVMVAAAATQRGSQAAYRCARRMLRGRVAQAWSTWRGTVASGVAHLRAARLTAFALRRLVKRHEAAAFFTWRTHVDSVAVARRLAAVLMKRAATRFAHKATRGAIRRSFQTWALEARGQRRLRSRCGAALGVFAFHYGGLETKPALRLLALSRTFRRWFANAGRLRTLVHLLAPKLGRASRRAQLRRGLATWERNALALACREMATRRSLELATEQRILDPVRRRFAQWRLHALGEAREELYAALAFVDARPEEMRHSAYAGALTVALLGRRRRAGQRGLRGAVHTWKRQTAHARGAAVLASVLRSARDALLAAAMEHWAAAARRKAQVETRLWAKIQHRVLLRAWLHWWTQVEVLRELQNLQRGVRALVRVRGHH